MKKVLLILLDGVPEPAENKQTTLQQAVKPTLDFITKFGSAGLIDGKTVLTDCGRSIFSLLGLEQSDYAGRGYYEALGAGMNVKDFEICLPARFASVREVAPKGLVPTDPKTREFAFEVLDYEVGREKDGLYEMSKDISEMLIDGVKLKFQKSIGHRGVLSVSNIDISPEVSTSYNLETNSVEKISAIAQIGGAEHLAASLNKWQMEVWKVLREHPQNKYRKIKANFILLGEAGKAKPVKSFSEKFGLRGAVVASSPLVKGIGRALGMFVPEFSGGSADTNTNLREKTIAALDALQKNDFVVLHILGADVASHDKKPVQKRTFIEKMDTEVFRRAMEYIKLKETVIVVAGNHGSSAYTGKHESCNIPFVIFGKDIPANGPEKFDEVSCTQGPLVETQHFMEEVWKFL
ncbi:MAG TPA: hypothetical protein VI933_05265 [archaeon]|nr:hypothetical protein [archaeon]